MINEIAWAGTHASSSDEWIELYNNSAATISLIGWILTDDGDINIHLAGDIAPHSYFLLERSDDQAISNIDADMIYRGNLRNSGETLSLLDPGGEEIDSANGDGGAWPSGNSAQRFSMERRGGGDISGNWATFTGWGGRGLDAAGNPIRGTPIGMNSIHLPSPSPTLSSSTPDATSPAEYAPLTILINEVAWAGTFASSSDEWIELMSMSSSIINLEGWRLTDGGDINILLAGSLPSHGFYLLERSDDETISNITADMIYTGSLNNSGDRLALFDPENNIIDTADGILGWPGGSASTRASMERRGGDDRTGNWGDYIGWGGTGLDARGSPVHGTPRQTNSLFFPSPTPSPTLDTSIVYEPGTVIINEIAWAGTGASASDEWIELMNTTEDDVYLNGWTLSDHGDVRISLSGTLPGYGSYLLERTDDNVIADVSAHMLYTGSLKNSGETLVLLDSANREIDTANSDGGGWPAGEDGSRRSMEQRGGSDRSGNWATHTGYHGYGHDAHGNRIQGTPGRPNSILFTTPVPTWIPGRIVINEVLIRPHYDWEGKGGVDTRDEFIELYNRGPRPVNIRGWWLDDIRDGCSKPHDLPSITIDPGGYTVFFRSWTHIALNDTGDTVRLLAPDGRLIDQISYLKVRAYNLSYGRLPDGSRHLKYRLWPTPGWQNIMYEESFASVDVVHGACGTDVGSRLLNSRFGRTPALTSWMSSLALVTCRRNTIETLVAKDLRGEIFPASQPFTVWDEHLSLVSATSQQERVR
jgi:hypothetical protein